MLELIPHTEGVREANAITSLDDALATTLNGLVPNVCAARALNVIDWVALAIWSVRFTGAAAS